MFSRMPNTIKAAIFVIQLRKRAKNIVPECIVKLITL